VQAWQLEFSRQIFWQKKLICKSKLPTEPTMWETPMKLFLATRMKYTVVSALISLAFVSQGFAVLRPLFPAKPVPPFNGEVIVIEEDSVMRVCKKTPDR
jgi:hypothetical protein